jgi:hypothetical protein
LRTVFAACEPRPEVLTGELREEIFAARLRDVIEGRADHVYQDPATFFENTYPTQGLKALIAEALGRISGVRPGNNAIIRLETAFGGGKTHNLIALRHLATGDVSGESAGDVVDVTLLPPPGSVRIAGIVGTDLDAEGGLRHGDIATKTLWGELAYQIRGAEGYQLVAKSDRDFAAPGAGFLEDLIGDQPTLILLDEIARHLRGAKAVPTVTGRSDLAEQTVAFLTSLLEFAASKERCVVVLTLADVSDAFGRETEELRTDLEEARKVSGRQERVITPTGETEISAIVTHRLFGSIDKNAAQEVAEALSATYRRLLDHGAELPSRAGRAEYAAEIVANYPFHPELLNTLNLKVATIPNFQKTRGALRLLAMIVRQIWDERPSEAVTIGVDDVDLGASAIADDLTSRLQRPAFKQVIEADIVSPLKGSLAHAQGLDDAARRAAQPTLAQRTATAILLHSLTQGVATGVDPADLALAVIGPDEDPLLVAKTTEQLVDSCWFLDWDGHRYRFKTEASLNKIVADEMVLVGMTKAKAEVDRRIRDGLIWRKGTFRPVAFPSEPGDIDDDAGEPKLAIVHYDAVNMHVADAEVPDLVRRLFENAGSAEGFRQYRNNLVFLVADADSIPRTVEMAQKHLALRRLVSDGERMADFNDEQRKKLKAMLDTSELDLRVAITRSYHFLFYPDSDAPQRDTNLAREALPAQDQGEVEKDQSAVVLRVLRQLGKVLTADDKPMAAAFVKAKAWDLNQPQLTTEDLRRAFARRIGLRILLDPNQLKRTIRDGAEQGTWVYYDAQEQVGYAAVSPAPLVRISEDAVLYAPEEAKRLGLKIKGEEPAEERCPVCGRPTDQCICGQEPQPEPRIRLHAEGAPGQAFQAIVDQARDQKVERLASLAILVEGHDKDGATEARGLGLAIPQLGRGEFLVEQNVGAEFGSAESLNVSYRGGWERYKRLKPVTDAFGQEATKFTARTTLTIRWPDGLAADGPELASIRDVFATLGFGRLVIDARPVAVEEPVS